MLKNIVIGKVVGVHGIRGALKVKAMTDFPERFKNTDELDVTLPAGNPKKAQLSGRYRVAGASVSGMSVLLLLDGVDDRNTAEFFRGAELSVRREEAVQLPEDTYFIGDLIGCKV